MTQRNAPLPTLGFLALVALLFTPVLWLLAPQSDYAVHVREAMHWAEHGTTRIPLPNFLFAGLTVVVRAALPGVTPLAAGVAVGLASYLALGLVLAHVIGRALPERAQDAQGRLLVFAIALSLMLAMPINLLTLPERNLYFGYVALAAYHNPTTILLKPLALLLFLQVVASLGGGDAPAGLRRIGAAAALTVLGTLAKPSFTIALLPALGAFLALAVRHARRPDWTFLVAGVVGPALLVLGWQFAYTYSAAQTAHWRGTPSEIVFAPLLVMRTLSPGGLGLKFALSVAFPACVYLAHLPRALRSPSLNLGWLVFGIGAFYAYALAETGPRLRDANFLWSAQIALFVLFVASMGFLLEQLRDGGGVRGRLRSRGAGLCLGLYGLHVASGLVWYVVQIAHFVDPGVPILKEWF